MNEKTLLVCRASDAIEGLSTEVRIGVQRIAKRCASKLLSARMQKTPVAHAFLFWPSTATLLEECHPRAIEPIFKHIRLSLLDDHLLELFCQDERKPVELVGVIEADIFYRTFVDAVKLDLDIRYDRQATLVLSQADRRPVF